MATKNDTTRNQVLKLTGDVGEIKGKVDTMDKNITRNFSSLEKRVLNMHRSVKEVIKNHDDRINKNEESVATIKGKAAGIAIVISFIVSALGLAIAFVKGLFTK